ncbi:MAG: hypothetical protein LBP68_02585 [Acidobacteriota bacterium]|nr:hypothetical protein [Acidobacteriota bacterium]
MTNPNAERLLRDCAETPTPLCYAWLEQESGSWRFLTSPFADPAEARRRWVNEQEALDELDQEGWQIIHAYPKEPGMKPDSRINGYGLRRTIH